MPRHVHHIFLSHARGGKLVLGPRETLASLLSLGNMPHEDEDVDQPGSHVKDTSEEVKGGDIENGLQEPLLGPDERVEDVEIEGGDDTKEGAIKQASFFDLFFFADKVS